MTYYNPCIMLLYAILAMKGGGDNRFLFLIANRIYVRKLKFISHKYYIQ